jgi:membrane-bound lytic murein transglycosylase D
MKKWLLIIASLIGVNQLATAQTRRPKPALKDSLSGEAFIRMTDETVNAFYADYLGQRNFDSIIDALEYEAGEIPDFSDDVYCERLKKMNEMSPFHLDCNEHTLSTIRFFAKNRRSFAKIAMGRSELYFDMYEAMLAKYDMPLELKYLSVIESGLRPQVKSPAGALGLWQFMYGTGKMYGLKENSHIDERMDPVKATDAACRFLKRLYDIYGDWNLALAAYNAGPGNVNKAIRRSGGKRTYWEVRPFLPRETQGYVPNFIAAAYLLTYYAEHNIVPAQAKIHYYQLDTMCLNRGIHMQTIAKLVDWTVEDIQILNPVYKTTYIPFTEPNRQCISGPLTRIGQLVSLEDSLYKTEIQLYGVGGKGVEAPVAAAPPVAVVDFPPNPAITSESNYMYHTVRKGETLTKIAAKYKVTNNQLMKLNKLRSSRVPVGKSLKIPRKAEVVAELSPVATNDSTIGTIIYDSLVTISHTVKRNESLGVIATKYNVSVEDIKHWNGLQDNWLNIDQKLRIETKIKLTKLGVVSNTEAINAEPVTTQPKVPVQKPVEKKKFYAVKSGDLFGKIAQKHGLTPAQLKKLNPGLNPDRIREGQQVRVK